MSGMSGIYRINPALLGGLCGLLFDLAIILMLKKLGLR